MKKNADLFFDSAASFLLLGTPLLDFLVHHGYPLLTPEVGVMMLGLLLVALLLGLIMAKGGRWIRPAVLVALGTLLVDIQSGWITTVGLRLLLVVLGLGLVAWVFRSNLTRVVTLGLGLGFVATLFLPGGSLDRAWGNPRPGLPERDDLPFVLHLVLDEFIGIEGIPPQFDPGSELAEELRDWLVDDGFQVQGRAYSRYQTTFESVSNLLNFSSEAKQSRYFPPAFHEGMTLQENAWFDQLRDQGYLLRVIGCDYISYGPRDGGRAEPDPGISGITYAAKNPAIMLAMGIPWPDRTRILVQEIAGLSFFLGHLHEAVGGDGHATRMASLSGLRAMNLLAAELAEARPGRAVFAHILLPHGPYGLLADGEIRPRIDRWRDYRIESLAPLHNTRQSRNESYPEYLQQVRGTVALVRGLFDQLRDQGLWDRSVIILHGDHGSRLTLAPPKWGMEKDMEPYEFVDSFATLYAVKQPGQPGCYLTDQLPIDWLFASGFRTGGPPGDPPVEPSVFCYTKGDSMRAWPMPRFAHGLPLVE